MKVYEYGAEHQKNLLMFQCAVEPSTALLCAAEAMGKDFHVFFAAAEGHDPTEKTDFISVEKYAHDAAEYLKGKGIRELDALYGVSMGGGAAIRFLLAENIPVRKAVIDAGITPYPYPKPICRLIHGKDCLMVRLATRSRKIMEMAYPPERWTPRGEDRKKHYDWLMQFYKGFTGTTIRNVMWSADNYSLPDPIPEIDTEIEYWYGEEEKKARKGNIRFVKNLWPQVKMQEFPGYAHAELVLIYPERFREELSRFLNE